MTASLRERSRAHAGAGRARWRPDWIGIGIPALIAYVPLLFTHRGMVGADTKTYLYLDPGKLLSEAPYLWNTDVGLGSVTHQNIGYLWPMGPFYWFFDLVNVPDWVAQRLWMGTVIFAAGMGVRYLLRTLGWGLLPGRRGGVLVATLAYMLSPYLLNYSARISVILLPWTALPWLIAFTVKALRRGGWVHPALFALVVLTVGGVNATALLLIGLGPLLWLIHAVAIDREARARQAVAAAARIALLTVAASLWWVAGLWAQGRYGLPVVRYTETYAVVASASSAPEVLRGLGYWLFYGTDKLGQWIQASVTYTRPFWLGLSYAVPTTAMVSAALLRWRYRTFFLTLVVVGSLAAIASYPWEASSLLGTVFKDVTRTDAGLSLRSTPRAVPLVALGLSVCLGAGVAALGRRRPRLAWPATAVVGLLVVANLPTLWNGQMVDDNLERPNEVPAYWHEAAAYLTEHDDGTRALEVPGADFASYRWGNTIDPVTPGLTERPYAARELFLWGSPQAADLQMAFDQRFHEGTMAPEAIAPVARLMGAGDIVLRSDLMYERYRLARPRQMWELVTSAPGLGEPVGFGPTDRNVAGPEFPLVDEIELAADPAMEDPPAVAIFPVEDPLAPTRTQPTGSPLLISGDGDGIVDLASIGGLHPEQALFYSASFASDPDALAALLTDDAHLVVTDSNRKRARTWNTLREGAGFTEQAGEESLVYTPGDQRLEVFPGAGDDAFTVTEQRGGVKAFATSYGNRGTLTPNDRPARAIDGDPLTAWRVADGEDPRGQYLRLVTDAPVTVDHVDLLQPQNGVRTRHITEVRLTFDGGEQLDVALDDSSLVEPGQRVTFPTRTFSTLDIEVLADSAGPRDVYLGQSGVGFAEVGLAGLTITEVIRPPVDLLEAAGARSADMPLTYVFTRLRNNPGEPVRTDPEVSIARIVDVPTARGFGLGGEVRLSAAATGELIDGLLGVPSAFAGGTTARASDRLPGDLRARASAAIDGDLATAWSTPFNFLTEQWVEVEGSAPRTISGLDLQVVADGRHSVPTVLTITADGDPARTRTVEVPAATDGTEPGATAAVPVTFEPLEGTTFRVTIDAVRPVTTTDWYTEEPIAMPVAIAELGIEGLTSPAPTGDLDTGCRTDLVTVDDVGVPVRVTGTVDQALDRQPLAIGPCEPGEATAVVDLAAGAHVLATSDGRRTGLDVDRVAFTSAAGGAAAPLTAIAEPPVAATEPLVVDHDGGVGFEVEVPTLDEPTWLSFGQSWNPGWTATVDGRDLGESVVIDGYANGWLLDPAELGPGPHTISITWAPQRVVWIGIIVSAIAVVACLGIIAVGLLRRRQAGRTRDPLADDEEASRRTDHRALPMDPDLALPFWERGSWLTELASRRASLVAVAALVAFMVPNTPTRLPELALIPIIAVLAWASFRSARGRGLLGLLAAGSYVLAAAYITAVQWRKGSNTNFFDIVDPVHWLGLAAIFLLLAEGVRDVIVRRRGAVGDEADDTTTREVRT